MSFTDVEICTNALTLIGAGEISSLAEQKPTAEACAVRYPMLRERLMVSYPWNFTIQQRQLSLQVASPTHKYTYKHALPPDRISDGVVAIYASSDIGQRPMKDYQVQGGFVLSEESDIYCDYQRDVPELEWPPYFVDVIVHALAADLAIAVTNNVKLSDSFYVRAYGTPSSGGSGGLMGAARVQDGHSAPANNKLSGFSLVDSRFRSSSYGSWH